MAKEHVLGVDNKVFIGEDIIIRCQMVKLDSDGKTEIVESDVSGNAYGFALKFRPSDGSALFTKATGGSGITFDNGDTTTGELSGANTVIVVAIPDTDLDPLTEGEYDWDIKRTDPGSEGVVAHGTLELTPGISV